jgi:hypothetical protein
MLHPSSPRLITVGVALALGIVGFILAWPVESLVGYLAPVQKLVAPFGIHLTRELGFLAVFACPSLLVAGSLLRGI